MVTTTGKFESKEMRIQGGCPLCGGAIDLKLTPGLSWTYCAQCRWLSRPTIGMTAEGLQVKHPVALA